MAGAQFEGSLWSDQYHSMESKSDSDYTNLCNSIGKVLSSRDARTMVVGNQPNIKREGAPIRSLCNGKVIFANTGASRWYGKSLSNDNLTFVEDAGKPGFLDFSRRYPEKLPVVRWKEPIINFAVVLSRTTPFDSSEGGPQLDSINKSDKIILLCGMAGDHATFVQVMREATKIVNTKVHIISLGSFFSQHAAESEGLMDNFVVPGRFKKQFGVEAEIEFIVGKWDYTALLMPNKLDIRKVKRASRERYTSLPELTAPNGRYYRFLHDRINSYRLLGNLLIVNENWAHPLNGKADDANNFIKNILFPGLRGRPQTKKEDYKEYEDSLREVLKVSDCDRVQETLFIIGGKIMISGSKARLSPKHSFSHCGGKLIKVGTDMQDPYTDRSKTHTYPAAD
eukprot:GHVL01000412.1.p1 GENE.GHVL01000412.1~~GHVL01000412.1.p1  ORF type:complete len:396 (-),score=43.81 GHVL01000412.1:19-1206(-)